MMMTISLAVWQLGWTERGKTTPFKEWFLQMVATIHVCLLILYGWFLASFEFSPINRKHWERRKEGRNPHNR